VSALYGVFTHNDANDDAITLVIEDQIARGVSYLDSGAIDDVTAIDGVTGNLSILSSMKTDDAKVMFFGDSISNNGGTDFTSLWHASLFAWHPDRWAGAWYGVQASVCGMLQQPGPGVSEEEVAALPGDNSAYPAHTYLQGEYSVLSRGGTTQATTSQAYQMKHALDTYATSDPRPTLLERFDDSLEAFQDSDGTRRVADGTEPLIYRPMLFGVGTSPAMAQIDFRMTDPVLGVIRTYEAHDVNSTAGAWVDAPTYSTLTDSYTAGGDGTGTGEYNVVVRETGGGGSKDFHTCAHFWGKSTGMTVSYAGYGGWQIDNHSEEYPNGPSFSIGTDGPSTWGYSNEHIAARMAVEETSHCFIHLGSNDLDATAKPAATAIADIDQLVTRLRAAKSGVKFVLVTVYGKDAEIADPTQRTNREAFNVLLKEYADNNSADCVCVDLASYCESQFVDQAAFGAAWLFDGVHPNTTGAYAMQLFIWDRVVAATTGSGNLLGNITVSDPGDTTVDTPLSYTAAIDGSVTDATYLWSVTPGTGGGVDYTIAGGTTANATITFHTADTYTVTCTASSATAADTPVVDADVVTVVAPETILTTWTKEEDSATALSINGSGWYQANTSAYTLLDSTGSTWTTTSTFPRMRYNGSVQVAWIVDFSLGNQTARDAFVTAYPNMKVRMTVTDTNGLNVTVTSDDLATLISTYGATSINPLGNASLIRMIIEDSKFTVMPDNDPAGNGTNIGMNADMYVKLEIIE